VKRVFNLFIESKQTYSKFSVAITKKKGVEYTYISGLEPSWQNVVTAATMLMSAMDIPAVANNENNRYVVRPNNIFDERFVPILEDNRNGASQKLPLTVDADVILEHHFRVPFSTAVKTLLAVSMSYTSDKLEVDGKKYGKVSKSNRQRFSAGSIEE